MNLLKKIFGQPEQPRLSQRKDEPDVYHVHQEEDRMNAAMEKARLTLNYFKESIIKPQPHQQYFSLKARIEENQQVEHLWLTEVSFDDSNIFYGTIGNKPLNLRNVSLGTRVGIIFDHVSDWMIVENGRLIGGYTIRALREGLADNKLEVFDKDLGMYIDEGADYFEHDLSTPEGAILCLEDAYDEQNIAKVMACKDFETEAKLLLSKMKGAKQLLENEGMIAETSRVLQLSLIKYIQDNGFPSFAGITRAFPKREYVNDDLCIIEEVCFYPAGGKSCTRLYVSRKGNEWRVLNSAD